MDSIFMTIDEMTKSVTDDLKRCSELIVSGAGYGIRAFEHIQNAIDCLKHVEWDKERDSQFSRKEFMEVKDELQSYALNISHACLVDALDQLGGFDD